MITLTATRLRALSRSTKYTITFRTKNEPIGGGQGRSPIGKIAIAGAVELKDGKKPGRIRLMPIAGYDRKTLHAFVTSTTTKGSAIWTDGNTSYATCLSALTIPA